MVTKLFFFIAISIFAFAEKRVREIESFQLKIGTIVFMNGYKYRIIAVISIRQLTVLYSAINIEELEIIVIRHGYMDYDFMSVKY